MFMVFKYNLALAAASISTTKLDASLRRKYLIHGTKHGLNAQEMALMLIQQNPEVVDDLNLASETIRRWRSEGKIREEVYDRAKLALMFEFKA